MELHRIDYIRHQPTMTDYNMLVDTINAIITRLQSKREVVPVNINREVKDFTFFQWRETKLPYTSTYLLLSPEDAYNVFDRYELTYKETSLINRIITEWNIVSLDINVKEIKTKKDKKQEVMFDTIESVITENNLKIPAIKNNKKKTKEENPRKNFKHK